MQQIGHLATARSRLDTGDDRLVVTWWGGHQIHAWPVAFAGGNTQVALPVGASLSNQ